MTKRAWSALMVAVAVIALLAVSFVPHHHHNGFMCLADEHYSCSDSHGTDVADVWGEADSCTAAAHHWHCDGNSGLCDGKEGHCGDGSGHNDDRSYCIEDEAFLNSRTENYQMHLLPQPVQFFIAVVIAYLADDIAINDEEHDFGDLPPCLYKSANVDGTFSLRAPPFFRA